MCRIGSLTLISLTYLYYVFLTPDWFVYLIKTSIKMKLLLRLSILWKMRSFFYQNVQKEKLLSKNWQLRLKGKGKPLRNAFCSHCQKRQWLTFYFYAVKWFRSIINFCLSPTSLLHFQLKCLCILSLLIRLSVYLTQAS